MLIKLWSVLPKLFEWPPIRSLSHLIERISLVALVGGILFELVTGLLNISYDYVFGFSFYTAHLWGAVVFVAGFVVHLAVKLPLAWRSVRRRKKPSDGPDELAAPEPGPRTISRRGVFALAGGSAAVVTILYAGQTIGGFFRPLALLSPRGGPGSPTFPINRTAMTAQVSRVDDSYRLQLIGRQTMSSVARSAGSHAADDRGAADRLRGGLVVGADLDRGAAVRPRQARRDTITPSARTWNRWRSAGPTVMSRCPPGRWAPPKRCSRYRSAARTWNSITAIRRA